MENILVRPLISEKSMTEGEIMKYRFEVPLHASKIQIKRAVETQFDVTVTSVNTHRFRGKPKRLGQFAGKKNDWKKAVITVKEGDSIDLYGKAG